MNRTHQTIIFLSIFLAIYLILNSYVVLRLGSLLGIQTQFLYYMIAFVTLGLPATMFIENRMPNLITKIIYTISALWMGILLFLFITLLLYEMIRPFYTLPYAGFIILTITLILSTISIMNALTISIKHIEIPFKKNVTIAQISDLHIGTIRNSAYLRRIAEKINEEDPDIVMITGDLVDATAPLHKSMFSPFNQLRAPVYFVSGNHEMYEGLDKVYELFNGTKITPLKNEAVTFDGIQIVGIEFSQNKTYLAEQLSKIKISKPSILMYHPPIGMEDAKKAGISLQLSGHTHDGQIFPFNLIVQLFFNKINGLYDLGNFYLYVSPGTGTWGPYMRLGSRNEITILKLKS